MNYFVDTVLFDLNETIIHQVRTERSHMASTYAPLAQNDWGITFEAFEAAWVRVHQTAADRYQEGVRLLHLGQLEAAKELLREPWYWENIAAILAELGLARSNRLIAKLTWAFQDSWVGGLRMPEGNPTVLRRLVDAGHRLGIVTNFQQPDIVPDILDSFGIREYFRPVVISATVGYRKPYPELFQLALTELGMEESPERVAYVGDNLSDDIDGARYAGLSPILIDTKSQHKSHDPSVPRIRSLVELPKVLQAMQGNT